MQLHVHVYKINWDQSFNLYCLYNGNKMHAKKITVIYKVVFRIIKEGQFAFLVV